MVQQRNSKQGDRPLGITGSGRLRQDWTGRFRGRSAGYVLAVATTALATLLRFAVDPLLADTAQFVTFFAAVVLTGAIAGRGPALATTLLSAIAVTYFFVPPRGALFPIESAHVVALAMFAASAAFIGWIAGRMHTARRVARQEADRANDILDSMGDGYLALDRHWTITAMNSAAERSLGVTCPQMIGRSVWECFPEAIGSKFQREYEQVLRDHEPVRFDEFYPPLGKWFDISAYPTAEGLAIFFRDISARKQAEALLRQQQEWLRVTLNSIGDAVLATDVAGRVTFLNPVAAELTGWNEEEATGQPVGSVFPVINEQSRQPADDVVARVFREKRIVALANHSALLTKDGREVPIEDSAAPIFDATGNLAGVVLVFHDVTARRRAQEALARREQEMRTLLEHLPVGAWLMDASGKIVYGNPAAQRIWCGAEYALPEQYGVYKGWWADTGEAIAAEEWAAARAVQRGETSLNEIVEIESFDGTRKIIRNGAVPIRADDGAILGAVILNEDITEQRQAEATLQKQRAVLDGIMKATDVMLVYLDRDFHFVMVNPAYAETCKMRPDEMVGKNHFDLYPHAENEAIFRQVRGTGVPVFYKDKPFEFPDQPERGVTYWDWSLTPVKDASGQVAGLVFSLRETTKYKQAEEALRRSEEHLRIAALAAEIGVWSWKPGTSHVTVSANWRRLFGIATDAEVTLETWRDALHPDDRERAVSELKAACERCREFKVEYRIVRPDGTIRWIVDRGRASYDEHGHAVVMAGVNVDLTDRKQAEEVIEHAKVAAEQANQAKSQFLANVSHELRTPMSAILGMTDLALGEELSPQVRDYLQTARSSADLLLAVVNEILDFSRIEAGKLALEALPFRLRPALEDTVKALTVRANEKGLRLACEISEDVPDCLVGDSFRLRQILVNLIGNAIKFTQHGHVVVRVGRESRSEEAVWLRFAVEDTGIGIAREHQSRIFEAFSQADSSMTRQYGGTGLGLAIASNLVQMMGGRIEVQSEYGKGSIFSFNVRLEVSRQPLQGKDEPGRDLGLVQRSLRILVVEDTLANQKLVQSILTKRKHTVDVASNGREAVAIVYRQDFDVILMDIQMPEMDGFQATAAIRAMRDSKASVSIIAMTAHAMKGDQERCLAAGMDAYIAKPINSRELIELVERLGNGNFQ